MAASALPHESAQKVQALTFYRDWPGPLNKGLLADAPAVADSGGGPMKPRSGCNPICPSAPCMRLSKVLATE